MNQLLIQQAGERREIALLEDGHLVSYLADSHREGLSAEDIYLGQVGRVMRNLAAAFVRLDKDVEGFLPFDQIPGGSQPRPGDALLVQVKKPPQGSKAAFLTADIMLPGALVILTPLSPALRVSKRVPEGEERQRLLQMAQALRPQGMGLIMREESQGRLAEDIQAELDELLEIWQQTAQQASQRSAPSAIRQAPDQLSRLLREMRGQPDRVLSNVPEALTAYGVSAQYAGNPLQLHEVQAKLRKALRRKVYLKSGATLIIDPCEAMTVIDVNTAQNIAGKDREKALRDTNIEAAQAIARLLRLRRVGGMVLIDFIDMQQQESKALVLQALKDALARDPVKTAVHGFTSLGLVELTRKRAEEPLSGAALKACPACQGRGYVEDDIENDA